MNTDPGLVWERFKHLSSFGLLNGHMMLLSLSQTTNFGLFQTYRGCRRHFQIWWKWHKVLQMRRKHCGKRRNCSLRAISPFPTVFSKDLYCRHVKTRACLGKGYGLSIYYTTNISHYLQTAVDFIPILTLYHTILCVLTTLRKKSFETFNPLPDDKF